MERTVLITGATSGIGLQSAIRLSGLGAQVVITSRDRARGMEALNRIDEATDGAVLLVVGDLATRAGVEALAAAIQARVPRLDVVVNGAIAAAPVVRVTEDGLERDFAVNAAAPHGLVRCLLPALQASPAARVVNVTGGLAGSLVTRADGDAERAIEVVTLVLARRLASVGITVNIVDVGQAAAAANGIRAGRAHSAQWDAASWRGRTPIEDERERDTSMAADAIVWAAVSPELEGVSGQCFASLGHRDREYPRIENEAKQEALLSRIERVWEPAAWP